MRLTQEIVEKKLSEAPDNIREAVTSEQVASNLAAIIKESNLHADQGGILEEETLYLMLGLQSTEDYINNLQRLMRVDQSRAHQIAEKINKNIFLFIRKNLQHEDGYNDVEPELKADTSEVNREKILAEIEDPKPSIQPITTSSQGDAVANAFIGGKLTETVRMPQQKATIELKKPEPPKKYSADPYREPTA